MVGRLAEGQSHEQATAEIQTLARRLGEQYPDTNDTRQLSVLATESIRIFPRSSCVSFPMRERSLNWKQSSTE